MKIKKNYTPLFYDLSQHLVAREWLFKKIGRINKTKTRIKEEVRKSTRKIKKSPDEKRIRNSRKTRRKTNTKLDEETRRNINTNSKT